MLFSAIDDNDADSDDVIDDEYVVQDDYDEYVVVDDDDDEYIVDGMWMINIFRC